MKRPRKQTGMATWLASLMIISMPVLAQTDLDRLTELEAKTTAMAEELAILRAELEAARQEEPESELEALRSEVAVATQTAQRAEKSANEWKNTSAVTHISGYAAAGFTSEKNGTDSFDLVNFNPIFHFQYGDLVMWESELEVRVADNGETEVGLEYSAINIFLNDYVAFVAGKFISPLGNFRQNVHPAWINKLPSAPSGFGHDGAAPSAEVGFQLRGGMTFGEQSRFTYAAYIGNGPKLEGVGGELHGIETGGFAGDKDDEKIIGGRISFLPVPKLELGFSGAFGDAAVVENDGLDLVDDPSRAYTVLGADLMYRWNNFGFLGEYIQQDIADNASSLIPMGGKWESWYLQSAYRFAATKWEGVLRYTDYTSPHPDESQEQWTLGVNYLLTPNSALKVAYEVNDGLAGAETDNNRWLLQVAYGY